VTFSPRDSRIDAREALAIPLPREETTPPVMKIYFVGMKSNKVEMLMIP
jgi:hypothetical protein